MIWFFGAAALAIEAAAFGPAAVWHPPPRFRQTVLAACQETGAGFGDCFSAQMKKAGATSQALDFTRLIHTNGYLEALRPVGRVSVAAVAYPFRANENNGLYLLNGQPSALDVDDLDLLPQEEIKNLHPDGTLWPGDRTTPAGALAIALPDGSQRFVIDYRVQKGCHAWAVLGQAFFSFAFDPSGKFDGVSYSGFTPDYRVSKTQSQKIATVENAITFTLLLPANRTTGYSWRLAPAIHSPAVANLDHRYEKFAGKDAGAGGQELWTFHATSLGEANLQFSYGRPWTNTPAAQTLHVIVHVR